MDDLKSQHLDLIELSASGSRLLVQYSEPDQGGTLLIYRFTLPNDESEIPTLEYGYTFDSSFRSQSIPWGNLPARLSRDLAPWLEQKRDQAEAANRPELVRVLTLFTALLGGNAA